MEPATMETRIQFYPVSSCPLCPVAKVFCGGFEAELLGHHVCMLNMKVGHPEEVKVRRRHAQAADGFTPRGPRRKVTLGTYGCTQIPLEPHRSKTS